MPDAALIEACHSFFSNYDQVATTSKRLLLETGGPKGAEQVRMAEIRAAIDLLHDCAISGTRAGNPGRLARAEQICLGEIQRPSSLPNGAGLHARARFVLAAINHMRGEPEVCAANIAHAFVVAPRWSRSTFPGIFHDAFRPGCLSIYDRLEHEAAKARLKFYLGAMLAKRAMAVGVAVGLLCAGFWVMVLAGLRGHNPALGRMAFYAAGPIWRSGSQENSRRARLARLRERFEGQVDRECRALALQML